MSLKLQQRAEEQTDAKVQDACASYINRLADRYRGICKENGITWFRFENDCYLAADKECSKSGNS